MVSDELIANLFRISQTEQKLKRDNVKGEVNANDVHFKDARISNMPFYYGNLGVEYTFNNVLGKNNILRAYWNYSYVHQYYLDYIKTNI